MRKIYTIVFALMVLLSVTMSATAAAPTKIIPTKGGLLDAPTSVTLKGPDTNPFGLVASDGYRSWTDSQ